MTVSEDAIRELAGLRRELESVSADRVQLEALYATAQDETLSLRKQVHDLNNALTSAQLEWARADNKAHRFLRDLSAMTAERDGFKALLESQKRATTGG